ncbi:tetratricopeptide repeat protein [Candidatus Latescibacterota bacterium]
MSKIFNKFIVIIPVLVLIIGILYVFMPGFSVQELSVTYPFDGTLFPPEIAPPTVIWDDTASGASIWNVLIEFQDADDPVEVEISAMEWTPRSDMWESIKKRSLEKTARLTITGYKKTLGITKRVSEKSFSITTSEDEVGAPIFFRAVTLPFEYAVEHMETMKWCLGDISSAEPAKVVLENMPVCGNCHSFTADGSTIGMDVDYANDKGSYIIADVAEETSLTNDDVITWADYRREDGELTYGLLSQMSPDGRYVVSTVKDLSVFVPVDDLYYSQLFFPLKGILVYYDRETGMFNALPGADDRSYVQSNPAWSPDGKDIVFARHEVGSLNLEQVDGQLLTTPEQCEQYISRRELFKFDLYKIPFNDGRGGEAVPLKGASNNGLSNYFAKYSPDGKWIVFCQANSFMLLQPDSKLSIIPAEGGEPREMNCNTNNMNSWHSWSPNGKWLVFTSKIFTPYTQLFLTHIDENGNDTPPVLLSGFTPPDRAANIPEFVNIPPDGMQKIQEEFVDYYSYANKGGQLYTHQDYEQAEYYLRKSIELNPDFALSHERLGFVLSMLNRLDEAEEEWNILMELDPENYIAYLNLGRIYLDRNDLEQAQEKFEKALSLNENCAPAHTGLGMVQIQVGGDLEGAKKHFLRSVEVDPNFDFGYLRLGTTYMYENDFEKAEEALRTAYKLNSRNSDTCFYLGIILSLDENNVSEAMSFFNRTLALTHSNVRAAQAYMEMGNLYLKSGDNNRALQEYERALKINPNDQNIRNSINRIRQQGTYR